MVGSGSFSLFEEQISNFLVMVMLLIWNRLLYLNCWDVNLLSSNSVVKLNMSWVWRSNQFNNLGIFKMFFTHCFLLPKWGHYFQKAMPNGMAPVQFMVGTGSSSVCLRNRLAISWLWLCYDIEIVCCTLADEMWTCFRQIVHLHWTYQGSEDRTNITF